jgi:uncharacterized membrane protein
MEPPPDELPLGRLEGFSDGVFAIAITLLVLDLGVSADAGEDLLQSILDEWPSLLAYLTSFLTIGVVWLQHSAITARSAPQTRRCTGSTCSCFCSRRFCPSDEARRRVRR